MGRTRAWTRIWLAESVRASLDTKFGLPVEARNRFALRSKRTLGCVSRMTTTVAAARAPPRMASSQNVQRQPMAPATNPPMSGPRTWAGQQSLQLARGCHTYRASERAKAEERHG